MSFYFDDKKEKQRKTNGSRPAGQFEDKLVDCLIDDTVKARTESRMK